MIASSVERMRKIIIPHNDLMHHQSRESTVSKLKGWPAGPSESRYSSAQSDFCVIPYRPHKTSISESVKLTMNAQNVYAHLSTELAWMNSDDDSRFTVSVMDEYCTTHTGAMVVEAAPKQGPTSGLLPVNKC